MRMLAGDDAGDDDGGGGMSEKADDAMDFADIELSDEDDDDDEMHGMSEAQYLAQLNSRKSKEEEGVGARGGDVVMRGGFNASSVAFFSRTCPLTCSLQRGRD